MSSDCKTHVFRTCRIRLISLSRVPRSGLHGHVYASNHSACLGGTHNWQTNVRRRALVIASPRASAPRVWTDTRAPTAMKPALRATTASNALFLVGGVFQDAFQTVHELFYRTLSPWLTFCCSRLLCQLCRRFVHRRRRLSAKLCRWLLRPKLPIRLSRRLSRPAVHCRVPVQLQLPARLLRSGRCLHPVQAWVQRRQLRVGMSVRHVRQRVPAQLFAAS